MQNVSGRRVVETAEFNNSHRIALKIVFNFLHELKKRSSDATGRH